MAACKSARQKIEADFWNIDIEDATLYRIVCCDENGNEYEEFIEILGNPEAKKFRGIHNDDVQKWFDKYFPEED